MIKCDLLLFLDPNDCHTGHRESQLIFTLIGNQIRDHVFWLPLYSDLELNAEWLRCMSVILFRGDLEVGSVFRHPPCQLRIIIEPSNVNRPFCSLLMAYNMYRN